MASGFKPYEFEPFASRSGKSEIITQNWNRRKSRPHLERCGYGFGVIMSTDDECHESQIINKLRCSQCKCLFPSAVSLEVHILTQHVKHVYKCNACPIACFSVQALQDHKLNTHGQTNTATHSYQQCQLCPDRLIPKSRLLLHVNDHSKDSNVRMYVYQCSNCSYFAQKKTDFAAHRATCSKTGKGKITSVPAAFTPDKVLQAHKIVFPSDDKNIKIVYGIPSNQMKLAVLPKSAVKNIKKVIYPKQGRKILPKFVVNQNGTLSNVRYISGVEGSVTVPENKNKTNVIIQKNSPDKEGNQSYVYMSEKKCETNADEAEILLSAIASGSKVAEKDPLSICEDNVTAGKVSEKVSPDSVQSGSVFRLCTICKKELVLIPQVSGVTNFPAWCVKCSKDKFIKKDNKYVLVSKDKMNEIMNPERYKKIKSNGKCEFLSRLKEENKMSPSKKNRIFKRSAGSLALSGPTSAKKSKLLSENRVENNKFRCHICKVLISMDWTKVQEHFSVRHPNFNLLLLSPKINKLNLNGSGMKVPYIVKDNKIRTKKSSVKINAEEPNTINRNKINGVDEVNEDHNFNPNCIKEELQMEDEDKESNLEDNVPNESSQYMKREYDIIYDIHPPKVKKKRKSTLKGSDKNGRRLTMFSSGQIVPALQQKPDADFIYKCSKCQYTNTSVISFREHIALHRTDNNTFQCMECGMCFVVKPSFEKHLFISHRIKDTETYIQNNNCCDNVVLEENIEENIQPTESSPPPEEIPPDLVENQCHVCREIFETSFLLNKHLRTHGMAFLLMKKRENKVV